MGSVQRSPLSPKELKARRANARKSTGPRTLEGKARVSFNRLQHGDRSARLQAFLRQRGANPDAFFALCKFIRLPGERVDPLQAAMVKAWLKSPAQVGSLGGGGFGAVVDSGHRHAKQPTVGSLLSAKKTASVMKGLSPGYSGILTAMVFESVLPKRRGLREVTFKASMSRRINEL